MTEEKAALSVKDVTVTLEVRDGTQMNAYLASPGQSGSYPGLLVFQEAYGVNEHIRDVTRRFAAQGFIAIAPELFHRTAPAGFEGDYGNFAGVMPHMKAVTPEAAIADAQAAFEWLKAQRDVSQNDISFDRILHGREDFLPREFGTAAAKGGVVLRRKHRSGAAGSRVYAARLRCCSSGEDWTNTFRPSSASR